MLITENAIRRIIEEEIEKLAQEGQIDEVSWKDLKQRAKMAGLGAAGMISALGIHSGDSRAPEQAYDKQTISSTAADDTDKETPSTAQKRVKPHFAKSSSNAKSKEPKVVELDNTQRSIRKLNLKDDIENLAFDIYDQTKDAQAMNKVIKIAKNRNAMFLQGLASDFRGKVSEKTQKELNNRMAEYGISIPDF